MDVTMLDAPLDQCHSLRRNPQFLPPHVLDALAASIRRDGFLAPVLLRPAPGGGWEVLSGNHRVLAARQIGLESVPAVVCDLDDEAAKRVAVNLNTIHGDPPAHLLAPFLAEMDDETLRSVHLTPDLLKDVTEFDAQLATHLADLMAPEGYDRESSHSSIEVCVCPGCGGRHRKGQATIADE